MSTFWPFAVYTLASQERFFFSIFLVLPFTIYTLAGQESLCFCDFGIFFVRSLYSYEPEV